MPLQYFTGSQAHNVHVRRLAKQLGLKVNEYGVFRVEDETRVAGATEVEVYQSVGLPWIPPELREDRQEFEDKESSWDDLLQLEQVRGDLHMHTTATDGEATIREMADAAIARGLSYIAITDHSQRVSMAMGLDADRLREQWRCIDEIRPEYEGRLIILKGIECDILEKEVWIFQMIVLLKRIGFLRVFTTARSSQGSRLLIEFLVLLKILTSTVSLIRPGDY